MINYSQQTPLPPHQSIIRNLIIRSSSILRRKVVIVRYHLPVGYADGGWKTNDTTHVPVVKLHKKDT